MSVDRRRRWQRQNPDAGRYRPGDRIYPELLEIKPSQNHIVARLSKRYSLQ
jgi:hypothetical protein